MTYFTLKALAVYTNDPICSTVGYGYEKKYKNTAKSPNEIDHRLVSGRWRNRKMHKSSHTVQTKALTALQWILIGTCPVIPTQVYNIEGKHLHVKE